MKWKKMAAAVLLLIALAAVLFVTDYYHAGDTAKKALESDTVQVEKTSYGWFFDGPADDAVFVFYPGAKVEETAYAPLLHSLAENGIDVCLVKMPLHFAVLGMNAADSVFEQHSAEKRYIGGHSLGGAVAANYAAEHELDGVILLAAYPTKEVEEPMLMIYGSEDGVLNMDQVAAAAQYGTVKEVVIAGGNHAGFGDYGEQAGDHAAAITAGEQRQTARNAMTEWLAERETDA